MELRILKKKDGTEVLQFKAPVEKSVSGRKATNLQCFLEWQDVPIEEEE